MPSKRRVSAVPAVRTASASPASCTDAILDQVRELISRAGMADDPAAPSQPPPQLQASDTATILTAIEQSKASVMSRIDYLATECTFIRADLDKIRGRLRETEDRISVTEDLTSQHEGSLSALQRTVQALVARADDAENRMRRNNVRVLGLPEGAEGDRPAEFAEAFFKTLLELREVPPTYVVERDHRVPTGRRVVGAPPRPFLVRFLNYRDRDLILREARKHPTLPYEHTAVHLYPDFTADLQKRRKTFTDVRRRLREREIKYSMLYPCRLRVQHEGSVKFFESPEEAEVWISTLQ